MKFNERYQQLLTAKRARLESLSEDSLALINELDSTDKWFEALAVCEAALDAEILDDNILRLRKKMFARGRELRTSVKLDPEDYVEWFDCLVNFNKKLADANISDAWVELSSLYQHTRVYNYDEAKAEEYLREGVNRMIPFAICIYGYNLYMGVGKLTADKTKGLEMMNQAKELGFEHADMYLLSAGADNITDPEAYIQKIKDYNDTVEDDYKLWYLIGDVYLEKLKNREKALEAYNKGIEINDPQSKYQKACLIIESKFGGTREEALEILLDVYEWNPKYVAHSIGEYYHFRSDQDLQQAIKWYSISMEYANIASMNYLSSIYCSDAINDFPKGLHCIDMAIKCGDKDALLKKANMLIDTEDQNYRNLSEGIRLLDQLAEAGDIMAILYLANGYNNGEYSEKPDYEKAFKYYLMGAELHNDMATDMVGRYYCAKEVGMQDYGKAVEYFNKAIQYGSLRAYTDLAICYEEGLGVERDTDKALKLIYTAAQNGFAYANTRLGCYYLHGTLFETDYDKAFEYLSKAEKGGDGVAYYYLGRIYKYAIGRPENPELALKYFRRAAGHEIVEAYIEIGDAYTIGYGGLEVNVQEAVEYMSYAAERNHSYAQFRLGEYYYYGFAGLDREKGIQYFHTAYENGSLHAAIALGECFLYGPREDYNKAFQYYQFAAEHNVITEGIGVCYQYGIGVEQNEAKAFQYFMIAADRNHGLAKYYLGLCYKFGSGTVQNLTEAFRWILLAATDNFRDAQYEVAMMYMNAQGVSMDAEKGIEWLRLAAEKEHSEAQLELGNAYLTGNGVEEDEIQAIYWYQKSAENGNEKAQKIIGKHNKY
jgi:TPR repeat protein